MKFKNFVKGFIAFGFAFIVVSITMASCKTSNGEKSGFLQQVSQRNTALCGTYTVAEIAFLGGVATDDGMKNAQEFVVAPSVVSAAHSMVGHRVTISYSSMFVLCGPESTIRGIALSE